MASFLFQFDYADPHAAQLVDTELVSRAIFDHLEHDEYKAATGHGPPTETLRVWKEPSLLQRPAGLNPIQLVLVGMLAGLLGGIVLAASLRSRHKALA
jgi:uncharacterized protein involved in exopolysaccharide biosynthesis